MIFKDLHQPNFYNFRSFGPGLGLLVMLILLLITLIFLKVKTPTLPNDSKEQETFQRILFGAIVSSIVFVVVFIIFLVFISSSDFTIYFTLEFLSNFGFKVCFPIYVIRQTPNLNQYVYDLWLKFKAKFTVISPSNVIDVIV